jgi:1,4-dihydroxy-2-naphthoyl-CoA hydrolase
VAGTDIRLKLAARRSVEFRAVPNESITPKTFRRSIAGSFPGNLGIEVVRIDDQEVEGRLGVDERHLHPGGYVHGGVWVAFADTVAAWGTFRHLPAGHDFTTAELKANVFAAARAGDVLTATGRPLHVGRRTQVWEVRMSKDGRAAAFFTCTQMVLTPPS